MQMYSVKLTKSRPARLLVYEHAVGWARGQAPRPAATRPAAGPPRQGCPVRPPWPTPAARLKPPMPDLHDGREATCLALFRVYATLLLKSAEKPE